MLQMSRNRTWITAVFVLLLGLLLALLIFSGGVAGQPAANQLTITPTDENYLPAILRTEATPTVGATIPTRTPTPIP